MNNEDNLLLVGQIAEAASLLMMIGALLWLFQPEIEEALFSDKNYLDVKTIAVMLIVIPAVAVNCCGIYFLPGVWWMASALQWCAFGILATEVKCSRNKVRW